MPPSIPNPLFDAAGRPLTVGAVVGTGGEGAVFAVPGQTDLVAKVYHQPASREKADKLQGMARVASPALTAIAAWPTGTVHLRDGRVVGLLMPKVIGYREVHRLYSPAHRKLDFPKADWGFLVHTARNVASAVATVHAAGHVIGDINQGGITVSPQAMVKLIDCDSFQVQVNGRWFPCEVGVGHFTPPELQGKSFHGVTRTANHDGFGLAVILFHLLFMGRHPFAGRYAGTGDMPIEQAIHEYRFAFGRTAAQRQMQPPPHSLALTAASTDLATLFERAFAPEGVYNRPLAADWVAALDRLRTTLRPCGANPGHKYPAALGACPWCEIERGGGPDFFVTVVADVRVSGGFDLTRAWADIMAVPLPDGPPPALPVPALPRVPMPGKLLVAMGAGRLTAAGAVLAAISGIWGAGGGLALVIAALLALAWGQLRKRTGYHLERARRKGAVDAAERTLKDLTDRAQKEAQAGAQRFQQKRAELERLKGEYGGLDAAKARDRQRLLDTRREAQLKHFLERHFIHNASIPGIGQGRLSTLMSYGVETAADIEPTAILRIPGFGSGLYNRLRAWRASVEARFVFNPNQGIDPADVAALDARYARRRDELQRALVAGASELRRVRDAANQTRGSFERQLADARQVLAQARAHAA